MLRRIELLLRDEDGQLVLASPEVGRLTCALDRGNLVSPGELAGVLRALGETVELVVPPGATGRVVNEKPELVHHPVGWGDVVYRLAPLEVEGEEHADAAAQADTGALSFRSRHAGRFWHRPSPRDRAFAEVGDVIEAGAVVGLIEVMKTFTHVVYEAKAGLPARARITRFGAGDGMDVSPGAVLFELEEA